VWLLGRPLSFSTSSAVCWPVSLFFFGYTPRSLSVRSFSLHDVYASVTTHVLFCSPAKKQSFCSTISATSVVRRASIKEILYVLRVGC